MTTTENMHDKGGTMRPSEKLILETWEETWHPPGRRGVYDELAGYGDSNAHRDYEARVIAYVADRLSVAPERVAVVIKPLRDRKLA